MSKVHLQDDLQNIFACHVGNILSISHDAEGVLKRLDECFMLKPGSVGDPNIHLGAKLRKM